MGEIERYGFREFDVSNEILEKKIADVMIHVMMPLFEGKELNILNEGFELIAPRMVTMGDTIVYFSSTHHGS